MSKGDVQTALQVFRGDALPCKYLLSEVALILPDGVEFKDVEKMVLSLNVVSDSVRFWIGDLLVYAERNYGEMASQLVDENDYSVKSVADMIWVSKRVPPDIRRKELTWCHHREVAKLCVDEQVKYLEAAVENHLSVRGLREAINKTSGPKAKKSDEVKDAYERALHAVIGEARGSGLICKELFEDRLEAGKEVPKEMLVVTRMAMIASDALEAYSEQKG